MSTDTLFSLAEIEEAAQLPEVPRWVVEVSEILLFTYGGGSADAAEWWAVQSGRPGLEARITYILITPAGAFLHVACEDQEEAEWFAGHMHAHGCHPKTAVARRVGHPVTCSDCGERRPLFVQLKLRGKLCRPCHKAWANRTAVAL